MATNIELKNQIDSQIKNKTAPASITKSNVADNMKQIVDYVDQEVSAVQESLKTSTSTTLTAIQQVLPSDINSLNFGGGKAYLPTTDTIGKEVLVISNSANIEIYANVANTNKMFVTFNTFINKVILAQFEMYRFTYIGFGPEGYWKAEII